MIFIIPSQTFSNNKQSPLLHRNSGHSVQFSISSLLSWQSGLPSHKKLRGILTRKKITLKRQINKISICLMKFLPLFWVLTLEFIRWTCDGSTTFWKLIRWILTLSNTITYYLWSQTSIFITYKTWHIYENKIHTWILEICAWKKIKTSNCILITLKSTIWFSIAWTITRVRLVIAVQAIAIWRIY